LEGGVLRGGGLDIFLKKIKKYLVVKKRVSNFAPPKRTKEEREGGKGREHVDSLRFWRKE